MLPNIGKSAAVFSVLGRHWRRRERAERRHPRRRCLAQRSSARSAHAVRTMDRLGRSASLRRQWRPRQGRPGWGDVGRPPAGWRV